MRCGQPCLRPGDGGAQEAADIVVAAAAAPPPNPGQQATQALRVAHVPRARSALLARLHFAQVRAEPRHLADKCGAQQRCQSLDLVACLLVARGGSERLARQWLLLGWPLRGSRFGEQGRTMTPRPG